VQNPGDARGEQVSEHYFERELPCGYGWVFPAVNGVANVGVYQRSDIYRVQGASLRDLLTRFLERRADRLGDAHPVGPQRSWSLPLGPAPWGLAAEDLLLAGDAGFSGDPRSGEGIWQALETGIFAAETAHMAIERGGLGRALIAAHARRCARAIARPARVRVGVQQTMRWLVDRELYRSRAVRAGLEWMYGRGTLERSKSV
jgi:flavin-dependent dehydrogenase